MSKMIEVRLQEIADELQTLREAEEACEYALHYIAEVAQALPASIGMSHHAVMEMEDVHCEIGKRIDEMEQKIGEI